MLQHSQPISKDLLQQFYISERLTIAEIARRLGCSSSKVVYWMDKYGLERREISEAIYQWHNPEGDPFSVKSIETEHELKLFQLVIGLYIGEGSKKKHGEVSISNSDSQVIRVFIKFLCDICGVSKDNLFAQINVFDDVDLREVQTYWVKVTGLPDTQFYKTTIKSKQGGTYTAKSHYGTLRIGVFNTKLQRVIQQWCDENLDRYS